jgi:UDP-GlcNAc:undecaprenyl-phosphate/decaprenyl-phosphate GlcNAc-1-phosphate transferase
MKLAIQTLFISFFIGLALHPLVIRLLRQRGIWDNPNERSNHDNPVPRGAGIGILVALCCGVLLSGVGDRVGYIVLLGFLLVGIVGAVDDIKGLKAKTRLIWQIFTSLAIALLLTNHIWELSLVPLLTIWLVTFVNAFNFMDGINGISAITGIVTGSTYLVAGVTYGATTPAIFGAAILGASSSFLPFNAPHARVFLGDIGSYGLGFVIAATAWLLWREGVPSILALAPCVIYLSDTGTVLIRRAVRGEKITTPHRSHAYQRLVAAGLPHWKVSFIVFLVEIMIVIIAFIGVRNGLEIISIITILAVAVTYLRFPKHLKN